MSEFYIHIYLHTLHMLCIGLTEMKIILLLFIYYSKHETINSFTTKWVIPINNSILLHINKQNRALFKQKVNCILATVNIEQ